MKREGKKEEGEKMFETVGKSRARIKNNNQE